MPARLSLAPSRLQPASTTPEEMYKPLARELRMAHPVPVPKHMVNALSGLGRCLGPGAQSRDEGPEPSRVQLGVSGLGPGIGQVRPGAVDGLGHVAQMLLGVVDVDDFDGAGKLLGGQAPDPGGAVAEDDPAGRSVEAAPLRLALDALCEGGRLGVGVAAGRALDRGVVADRPGVAARAALGVASFGRPRGDELDLAGLGGAVGLLAAAPVDFGRAHRHAGAVQPESPGGPGGPVLVSCLRSSRNTIRARIGP